MAASTSTEPNLPCAIDERTKTTRAAPGESRSSTYFPAPVKSTGSSSRTTAFPRIEPLPAMAPLLSGGYRRVDDTSRSLASLNARGDRSHPVHMLDNWRTASASRSTLDAARFSRKWRSDDVPGMSNTFGETASAHARATCAGGAGRVTLAVLAWL